MGTKDDPGLYDYYMRAHPDEPLFTLLGRDVSAPPLVDAWAAMAERRGANPAKVVEARACAASMRVWCTHVRGEVAAVDGVACTCAIIQVLDAQRHFQECLRRAPLPERHRAVVTLAGATMVELYGELRQRLKAEGVAPYVDPELERLRALVVDVYHERVDHQPRGSWGRMCDEAVRIEQLKQGG